MKKQGCPKPLNYFSTHLQSYIKESLESGCTFPLLPQNKEAEIEVSSAVHEVIQQYPNVSSQELPSKLPPYARHST